MYNEDSCILISRDAIAQLWIDENINKTKCDNATVVNGNLYYKHSIGEEIFIFVPEMWDVNNNMNCSIDSVLFTYVSSTKLSA